jgi:Zn-dependent protease with chaperone function/Flp pilus assembly protein TadD
MSVLRGKRVGLVVFGGILGVGFLLPRPLAAQGPAQPPPLPSAAEVVELLGREPFSPKTWPAWRGRLLAWIGDRGHQTDAAYEAGRNYVKGQADAKGELPAGLADDAYAWYLLGSAYLAEAQRAAHPGPPAGQAEQALRRSLKLDPNFARTHRNLAFALLLQDTPTNLLRPKLGQARAELDQARRLDPALPVKHVEADAALVQKRYTEAENLYQEALREDPQDVQFALGLAVAVVSNDKHSGPRAKPVSRLLERFPDNPNLVCLHAVALAEDGEARAAARELERARQLGADPTQILSPKVVAQIEAEAVPSLLEKFAWVLGGFTLFYAVIMALMAFFGLILASRTRGIRALDLLDGQADELVAEGQVARTRHESGLAKWYALGLFSGLVLFYVAIPFLLAGLLAGTGLLLYFIFMLPRIPIKLIVIVVVVGLGGAWAVLKSLFASQGKGSFGLPKTAAECPRLHQVLADVATRVATEPVHEIYLAPGSSIGVHQEGRGPFGVFGVKRRVLTLGLSTLRFLTVPEFQSILAHEYAHFSHRDTFYNRFIYQVSLSIQQALDGMARAGGKLNYVNPFYWFLILYHKAYNLLASGFSRSREFLADRMASGLYGSDVFASALTKVSTDGSLFEMTIYDNIARLLGEGKAFINMYAAFHSFRNEQLEHQERETLYQKLLDEKGSLFASHPTFGERIEAVQALPKADKQDPTPALELLENAEEVEKELTDFLTSYIHYVRQARAAAAG